MKRALLAVVLACAAIGLFVVADRLVVTECERTESCIVSDPETSPPTPEDPFAQCRRAAARANDDEQDAVYEACVQES